MIGESVWLEIVKAAPIPGIFLAAIVFILRWVQGIIKDHREDMRQLFDGFRVFQKEIITESHQIADGAVKVIHENTTQLARNSYITEELTRKYKLAPISTTRQ